MLEVAIRGSAVKLGLPRVSGASHISPMTVSHEGWRRHALLTPQQMGEADQLTIAGGVQAAIQFVSARLRGFSAPRYIPYACSIAAGTLAAFLLPGPFP